VTHNLSEITGSSFLERYTTQEIVLGNEPLVSTLLKRYRYWGRHHRLGMFSKMMLLVGGLWLKTT
jgi:hypothetical protein